MTTETDEPEDRNTGRDTVLTFAVPDISCDHCVKAITDSVSPLPGVDSVEVDVDAKAVTVVGGDRLAIVAAIDDAGYDTA